MKKEESSEYYPPDEESARLISSLLHLVCSTMESFQGSPAYSLPLPPGFPHPVHPREHYHGGTIPDALSAKVFTSDAGGNGAFDVFDEAAR